MRTLELVRFTVRPENEAAMLGSRPRLVEVLRNYPGFIEAQLGRIDATTWVDLVLWESREQAESAAAKAAQDADLAPVFALIDHVVAFEHADVLHSAQALAH